MKRWVEKTLPPTRWADLVRFVATTALVACVLVPWYWHQDPSDRAALAEFGTDSLLGALLSVAIFAGRRMMARRRRLREWSPVLLSTVCTAECPFGWAYSPTYVAALFVFFSLIVDGPGGSSAPWGAIFGFSIFVGHVLSILWCGARRFELWERGFVLAGYWELEWSQVVSWRSIRREHLGLMIEYSAKAQRVTFALAPLRLGLPIDQAAQIEAILERHCPQAVRLPGDSPASLLASTRQFQIKHLMAAMMAAALFFALIGPWFRRLEPSGRWSVAGLWSVAVACAAFYVYERFQFRSLIFERWGDFEDTLRQPRPWTERPRTWGWVIAAALCLLLATFTLGPDLGRRGTIVSWLGLGLPLGFLGGRAIAALWLDELRIDVLSRALVLGEVRVIPFQSIAGYDLRQGRSLMLLLEYAPTGKVGGGDRYVEVQLPRERRAYFTALLAERCPGIGRTTQFRNRFAPTTDEPDDGEECEWPVRSGPIRRRPKSTTDAPDPPNSSPS